MTYAVVAASPEEGLVGIAIATSPPAVGARCPHLRPGVGAVSTQAHTDPSIGPAALDGLAAGGEPEAVLAGLAARPFFGKRQVAIVDRAGRVAVHTGAETSPAGGHRTGRGVAVVGNHLAGTGVLDAMIAAWGAGEGAVMEARLLAALAAGRDAGGDLDGTRSAAMKVGDGAGATRTDLRVDWAPDPADDAVRQLDRLVRLWIPLIDFYLRRPAEPDLGSWDDWVRLRGAT